jgi:diguanylate cyclase (GGDEF)-like protein/PAS domain S-box-containing protein
MPRLFPHMHPSPPNTGDEPPDHTLFRLALEQTASAVLITTATPDPALQQIVFANDAFCRSSGYSSDELIGATPHILDGPTTDQQTLERLRRTLAAGHVFTGTLVRYHKDGHSYPVELQISPLCNQQGQVTHYVAIQRPGPARQAVEAQLFHRSPVDQVTNLPNRYVFMDRLATRIAVARARGERFAVCLIDLDRFNRINDTLGHAVGDDVLVQVAIRLHDVLGANDILARMGGDEFGVVLNQAHDEQSVGHVTARLLAALEAPVPIAGQHLFVSASIGVSLFPRDGHDSTTLLKHADSAMYRSKGAGRNMVSWFDPELSHAAQATLELDQELRYAVDHHQFVLHYQPQINMARGTVVGVEALLRWEHPRRGLLAPASFLAAAEDSPLMKRICSWALKAACRQAAAWQLPHLPPVRISVNISAPQFERSDIVRRVEIALADSGLVPERLELEITESMLMRDPAGSAVKITRLRDMGVSVALDDFGTGYSSLAYLQQFPVDALKIDRSFIAALGPQPRPERNTTALVRAFVALARTLGLRVVAEGIEHTGQHRLLRDLGYDEGQGYFYAHPTPANQVVGLITTLNQHTGEIG